MNIAPVKIISRRLLQIGICYLLLLAVPLTSLAQLKTAKNTTSEDKTSSNLKKNNPKPKVTPLNLGKLPQSLKMKVSPDQIKGETFTGEPGITETVEQIMERERNTPKKPFDPNFVEEKPEHEPYRPNKIQPPDALNIPRFPYNEKDNDSLLNDFLPQTPSTSIAGPGRGADGITSIPPDSVGDVGPTQVLMHANGRIKVYDKFTGAVGGLDVVDTTFWNSVRNGVGISDPRVEYDRLSGRWFLCMINVSNTLNRVMIAVSSGPTITNTASFTFFQFSVASLFIDYPTLGVDANALYIGGNIFTSSVGTFDSTRGYVINKANLLANTLTVTTFNGLVTGAGAGPLTPQGVSNDDASFTEGYFIGTDNVAFSLLQMRRVSTPGGTPTISADISIATPTTTYPLGGFTGVGVPYQGLLAGRSLDDLDDRLFQAQITRDNVSGVSRLWTSHNIEVTTAGVASTAGNRNGSRWYEITSLTGTPTINQSGTLFDSAAANPNSYWIPSVAVSGQGHMALGASSAGNARFPSLYAAGRLRTDTLGATQAPTLIQTSTTTYNLEAANTKQRWGDYSKTSVDPCDNQSMWHVGEYCDAANSWRMRAVKLNAPGPPASVTPMPTSAPAGAPSVNVVVTGVSVSGTEFYDNPAGFVCSPSCNTTGTGTCRMAASVTSSPLAPTVALTINSVTFNSPTQVTLNISTVGATPGVNTIQIRNPDGQATNFNFTVNTPTAATTNVGGRITDSFGNGIRNVTVTRQSVASNEMLSVQTGNNGEYVFPETLVGQNYIITPARSGYTFEPVNRVLQVVDELDDVHFTATSVAPNHAVDNDFDGDGRTDFAVFRPTERRWYIWQSSTQSMRVEEFGLATDLLAPADFDGDGKTDLAVFRPNEGNWYIKRSSDGAMTTTQFGMKGDVPVAGYFDNDGRTDLAIFRPKDGVWYIRQSTDNQTRTVNWGIRGDKPLAADFDGDGLVDPTIYRPNEGRWYLKYSANGSTNSIPFGVASDAIAPGDYDGDGRADIALYRGEAGAWFIQRSSDASGDIRLFGRNGDKVVTGDYDGDGQTDNALYRPDNSTWYVRQTNGGFTALKWGQPGDYPAIPSHLR